MGKRNLLPKYSDIKRVVPIISCSITLKGHKSRVNAIIELTDGRLASSSMDTTIKVWNMGTGNCDLTLKGHEGEIWGLVQCKNGNITSGSDDSTVKIWNLSDGACVCTLENTSPANLIAELTDGRIAAPSDDSNKRFRRFPQKV